MESQANQPPILAPGLSCLIWPMHPVEFMTKIWQKKAYVVQGCGERLQKVKQDFMNYDVEQLVSQASDCVVWMKTTDGKIQHLYADNKTAYHCYLAGHSLYFNPPVALQKSYIKQLAEDLGANFGLKKDDGFGGDIEIFAVRGKHVTDWHFDAQENFTIQLTGRKRWSISPGVFCPVTNHTNPKNIATEKYDEHRKVHASYAPAADVEPPKDFSQAQTFVLRPGSVMYVPAGYWHHVTCDSDEGSLSINFSMSTSSWLDLLMNSLGQHLWKYQHWRENIIVKDPSSARAHLRALLTNLPREIGLLSARDFLPQGLFREHKEREVNVDTSEQGTEVEITKDTVLRRNPVAVISKDKPTTTSAAAAKRPACPPPTAFDKGGRKRALQSMLGDDKEGGGDDDDGRERQGKESWTLHLAFGNKDFKSSLEAKIFVKRAMGCVLDWVERRQGARGPDAANEADGGRWAAFTAGQLYSESGYRDLVKARKAARDQRRKRRRSEDQNAKAKRHVRKNENDDGDDDDDEEGMGRFEDEDDEEDEDEMDEEEQREGAVGGFGDVEQLLSVLVFNGYLTKVKSNKAKEGAE